ncbi:MAG: RNA polymerase sigma factor [Bacteroidota bacterium]
MKTEPEPANELLSTWIRTYQAELTAFVHSRIGSAQEAEDLLQEVWLQLSRTQARTPIQQPRAWLYRVLRNKIIDHYRKQSPEWLAELLPDEEEEWAEGEWLEAESAGPDEYWLRENFWEALYEALELLPEAQRMVFVKHELEGLTLREIAEQSEENLKTIISRKGYAVRQLRNLLADWWAELVD